MCVPFAKGCSWMEVVAFVPAVTRVSTSPATCFSLSVSCKWSALFFFLLFLAKWRFVVLIFLVVSRRLKNNTMSRVRYSQEHTSGMRACVRMQTGEDHGGGLRRGRRHQLATVAWMGRPCVSFCLGCVRLRTVFLGVRGELWRKL